MAMALKVMQSAPLKWRPTPSALISKRNPKLISSLSTNSSGTARQLVLYSKPGCCLCDGLKEKLQAAFLLSGPQSLNDVVLHVRDITTKSEWESAYQYEIPVLKKLLPDGSEEMIPRISPRASVESVQKKIFDSLG